jgi:hypothetical protein
MVLLNGLPQKIHIQECGRDKSCAAVFAWRAGVCNRHTIMTDHADLSKTFTIVAWDQRGSGGSYYGAKKETLTVDQLVEDANALVGWLFCERFHKDKIFIIAAAGVRNSAPILPTVIRKRSRLCRLWSGGGRRRRMRRSALRLPWKRRKSGRRKNRSRFSIASALRSRVFTKAALTA